MSRINNSDHSAGTPAGKRISTEGGKHSAGGGKMRRADRDESIKRSLYPYTIFDYLIQLSKEDANEQKKA